jgi:DNA helicase II / ATP-dependent DNA helicase PcrA
LAALSLLTDGVAPDLPLDGLTAGQRDAATHSDARLVILGGAGTGKTRVVEARFRWLVAEGCDPERIGLLVPSDARAAAMRARIETRLRRGYDELYVLTPARLAGLVLRAAGAGGDPFEAVLTPGDRLAMLVERIDELSLRHHDFGGRPNTLLGGFVRRIDRLKAELVGAEAYAAWA